MHCGVEWYEAFLVVVVVVVVCVCVCVLDWSGVSLWCCWSFRLCVGVRNGGVVWGIVVVDGGGRFVCVLVCVVDWSGVGGKTDR